METLDYYQTLGPSDNMNTTDHKPHSGKFDSGAKKGTKDWNLGNYHKYYTAEELGRASFNEWGDMT
jgi:hypothetical protein